MCVYMCVHVVGWGSKVWQNLNQKFTNIFSLNFLGAKGIDKWKSMELINIYTLSDIQKK